MNNSEKRESSTEELHLTQTQVSWIVAGFLLLSFFIFVAGYYWGKKSSLGAVLDRLSNETLADQVHQAFYSPNKELELEKVEEEEETKNSTENSKELALESRTSRQEQEPISEHEQHHEQYYATLGGFGSLRGAQRLKSDLATKGFASTIVKRTSRTSKGKTRYWYQVTTAPMTDKEQLHQLVERIKKNSYLKDITIVTKNT